MSEEIIDKLKLKKAAEEAKSEDNIPEDPK